MVNGCVAIISHSRNATHGVSLGPCSPGHLPLHPSTCPISEYETAPAAPPAHQRPRANPPRPLGALCSPPKQKVRPPFHRCSASRAESSLDGGESGLRAGSPRPSGSAGPGTPAACELASRECLTESPGTPFCPPLCARDAGADRRPGRGSREGRR